MSAYSQLVLATANLVGYWRMDALSGTSEADASGNGNTGTYQNAPTLGVQGAIVGDGDTAVTFAKASTQWCSCTTLAVPLTAYTIMAAVKIGDLSGFYGITGHWDGTNGAGIWIGATNFELMHATLSTEVVSSVAPVVGPWYWVAGTWDGATAILYVNGANTGQTSVSTAIGTPAAGHWNIGSYNDGVGPIQGTIDEVAVFSRALSAAEIAALYQAGLGGAAFFPTIARLRNPNNIH